LLSYLLSIWLGWLRITLENIRVSSDQNEQRQVSHMAFVGTSGLNMQLSDGHACVVVGRNAQLFRENTWFAFVPYLYFRPYVYFR
jgi:hypothetical protein